MPDFSIVFEGDRFQFVVFRRAVFVLSMSVALLVRRHQLCVLRIDVCFTLNVFRRRQPSNSVSLLLHNGDIFVRRYRRPDLYCLLLQRVIAVFRHRRFF